jgi:protoheme IX farnesyltransferase
MTTIAAVAARPSLRRLFAAYVELTKPRIVTLVIVTGVPALLIARRGLPSPMLATAALLGTALAAGSAACFNHYYDRDIDGRMRRTAARPLPSGLIPPTHALALGGALGLASVAVLASFANLLAAGLGLASIFYYAVVYTIWLKRRTPQNIVIGGAAGASAPLIAWASVTGQLGFPAMLLASIVFLWTPPHFWALSLYRCEDYARAGIPMLPVTHGAAETRRQIVRYAWILVLVTLALLPLGLVGPLYAIPAALLGARFLRLAYQLRSSGTTLDAVKLFRYSIAYLFFLYVALSADAVVRYAIRGPAGV